MILSELIRRGGALIWLLELLRTAVGNSRNQIANGLFERAERRACTGFSRMAQGQKVVNWEDRRRLYYVMNHPISRGNINLVRNKRRNKRLFFYSFVYCLTYSMPKTFIV
jgi:hypothetical protein